MRQILENAVRNWHPPLVEEASNSASILEQDGHALIRLGASDVDYDDGFIFT